MKERFIVSKTYDVVTPESAKEGDFAENGYDYEKLSMDLSDAVRAIRDIGPDCHQARHEAMEMLKGIRRHGHVHVSIYGADPDQDYHTGESTTYAIHVEGKPREVARLINAACARPRKR